MILSYWAICWDTLNFKIRPLYHNYIVKKGWCNNSIEYEGGVKGEGEEHTIRKSLISGRGLQDESLKDVTSNLEEDLKEEALSVFLSSVTEGLSIKDCIANVQDQALVKVPNERNKWFIRFVYDNKLKVNFNEDDIADTIIAKKEEKLDIIFSRLKPSLY